MAAAISMARSMLKMPWCLVVMAVPALCLLQRHQPLDVKKNGVGNQVTALLVVLYNLMDFWTGRQDLFCAQTVCLQTMKDSSCLCLHVYASQPHRAHAADTQAPSSSFSDC